MKIIDNKKDYYDWVAGVYGIDEKIIYDRRGSQRFDDFLKEYQSTFAPDRKKFLKDVKKIEVRIGYTLYTLEREKIYDDKNNRLQRNYTLGKDWILPDTVFESISWKEYKELPNPRRFSLDELKHINTLRKDNRYYGFYGSEENLSTTDGIAPIEITIYEIDDYFKTVILNPILNDYPGITNYIPAETVWDEVSNFISSFKDKKIEDTRTDVQKLESAGFDKKTSFRNIK